MRKIYTIVIGVCLMTVSNAQWQWKNPSPLGLNIEKVYGFSTSEMVAVTNKNVVLKTIDGGNSWIYEYPTLSGDVFQDVSFSGVTGWLVGSGGIAKSTNKGDTWSDQPISGTPFLRGIATLSSTFAVAVGDNGKILRTTNGGTWSFCNVAGTANYYSVSFGSTDINTGKGFAVGENGAVAKTADGGQNWTALTPFTSNTLYSVFYQTSSSNIWAVGFNEIWKSNDDGATWSMLTNPLGPGQGLWKDVEIVGSRGYIVGYGRVLRSTDGGDNWNVYIIDPDFPTFAGISMTSFNQGWIVGAGGVVLNNTDGVSFNKVSKGYGLFTTFYGIDFYDANTGIVAGTGGTLKYTTDGGDTWNFSTSSELSTLRSVTFFGPGQACAVGDGVIIYSNDGGATWSANVNSQFFRGVSFATTAIGIAVGKDGIIHRTVNSAQTWSPITSGVTTHLNAVSFANANNGIAVGDNGVILVTNDAGNTWQPKAGGTNENLRAVHSIKNKSIAYAAGDNGTILRSMDGGNNWMPIPTNSFSTLNCTGVQGADENNLVVTTEAGSVLHTSNAGATWSEEIALYGVGSTNAVKAISGTNVWVSGARSSILKSQSGLVLLPINLSSFTAQTQNKKVLLNWQTSSELNNKGFAIMRKPTTGSDWQQVGYISSKGNSNQIQSYSFTDEPKGGAEFLYQLKQTDVDGKFTFSNIVKAKLEVDKVELSSYPNPAHGATTINYSLKEASQVQLVLRNAAGQYVQTIVNAKQTAGNYSVTLYTNKLNSGTYYAQMIAGKERESVTVSIVN